MGKISGINRYLDSTLLRPDATAAEVRRLCEEAAAGGFTAVCVNPSRLDLARETLVGSGVRLCTVVGFPLGADLTGIKQEQAEQALNLGAHEIDMVMNLGLFKDNEYGKIQEEIRVMADQVHDGGGLLKVIIETGYLSTQEIRVATRLVASSGADFVKTSSGFGPRGATVGDVRTIKSAGPEWLRVKASGGIRSLKQVLELIEAGADRIGTSSAGAIMAECRSENETADGS